jgi:hypothetical protein
MITKALTHLTFLARQVAIADGNCFNQSGSFSTILATSIEDFVSCILIESIRAVGTPTKFSQSPVGRKSKIIQNFIFYF